MGYVVRGAEVGECEKVNSEDGTIHLVAYREQKQTKKWLDWQIYMQTDSVERGSVTASSLHPSFTSCKYVQVERSLGHSVQLTLHLLHLSTRKLLQAAAKMQAEMADRKKGPRKKINF